MVNFVQATIDMVSLTAGDDDDDHADPYDVAIGGESFLVNSY